MERPPSWIEADAVEVASDSPSRDREREAFLVRIAPSLEQLARDINSAVEDFVGGDR